MSRRSSNFILNNLEPFVDELVSTLDLPEADRGLLKDRRHKVAFGHAAIKLKETEVRLERRLDEANRDPLTGLLNRRRFYEKIAGLNPDGTYAVVEIDYHGLKRANDAHGEDAGDRMLVKGAEVATNTLRSDALLCRWGGDEIKAVIPLDDPDAEPVMVRLKQAFGGKGIGAICQLDDKNIVRLWGRFGIAIVDGSGGESVIDGLAEAGKAMLEEKRKEAAENEGRGRGTAGSLAYVMHDGVILEAGYHAAAV